VYLIGEQQGIHYIAQEYVPGFNLAELIARHGPPDTRSALHIIRQVAQALEAAGKSGIVHRDIKPENILVNGHGEVKVADFGLAQLTLVGERMNLTQEGITLGTPLYMSPEQINGAELDQRSDLYSFGVTCYHMLSGRPPFRGETALSLAAQHVHNKPEPLGERRSDIPRSLCHVVHKMMAKQPGKRHASARAVLDDLKRIEQAMGDASENSAEVSLAQFVTGSKIAPAFVPDGSRRWWNDHALRRWAALAVACLSLAMLSAALGVWVRPNDPLQSKPRAPIPRQETVLNQYFHALTYANNERGWRAVLDYFDEETRYSQLARAQLLRLALQEDRLDEAFELSSVFIDRSNVPVLRAKGYTGHAVILSVRGKPDESQKIIQEHLVPLADDLDDTDRELVLETISENRKRLKGRIPASLEETFRKPTPNGVRNEERNGRSRRFVRS
jgi:serine/threonine-protein kinase